MMVMVVMILLSFVGAKSAGFGDREGLDCCYTSAVGINDGGSGRAFQGQWYMITYTPTAEEVDDEIIIGLGIL